MEFTDPYEHNDPSLIYISENIPTQETEDEFNEEFINGCNCEDLCTIETKCSCISRSGANYVIPKPEKHSNIYSACTIKITDVNKPIYECNTKCRCYSKCCGNRLVQFGPRTSLKIITCEEVGDVNDKIRSKTPRLCESDEVGNINRRKKGLGLITTDDIKQGNFICEYAGEIITKVEAIRRHEVNEQNGLMNYIFCINEHFGGKNVGTFIDPSKFGNIGRYINHSCQPNCELIPIRVNNTVPKLCIFAAQDIKKNYELTFDYGSDNLKLENVRSQQRIECLCGTDKCRKFMPFSEYTE